MNEPRQYDLSKDSNKLFSMNICFRLCIIKKKHFTCTLYIIILLQKPKAS